MSSTQAAPVALARASTRRPSSRARGASRARRPAPARARPQSSCARTARRTRATRAVVDAKEDVTSPSSSPRSSSSSSASWRSSSASKVRSSRAARPPSTRSRRGERPLARERERRSRPIRLLLRPGVPRELVVELPLAPRGSLLAGLDGLAPVARACGAPRPRAEPGGEPGQLLHGPRDRQADGADGRVGAVGHVDGAVGHLIDFLQLRIHLVDVSPILGMTGRNSRSVPLMNAERRAKVPPS